MNRLRGGPLRLQRIQAIVEAAAGQQLLVGAALFDAAVVEHVNAVAALHRGQTMGNHHAGHAVDTIQGGSDERFARGMMLAVA